MQCLSDDWQGKIDCHFRKVVGLFLTSKAAVVDRIHPRSKPNQWPDVRGSEPVCVGHNSLSCSCVIIICYDSLTCSCMMIMCL